MGLRLGLSVLIITAIQGSVWAMQTGVQASLSTTGAVTAGFVTYSPNHSAGIYTGFSFGKSGPVFGGALKQDWFGTIGIFGGPRFSLNETTYLAVGGDVNVSYGKTQDQNERDYYAFGPYVGIEKNLDANLILSVWLNPYRFRNFMSDIQNLQKVSHSLFSSGGIGLSYLF